MQVRRPLAYEDGEYADFAAMLRYEAHSREAGLACLIPTLRRRYIGFLEDQEEDSAILLFEAIKVPEEAADEVQLLDVIFDVADVDDEAYALLQRCQHIFMSKSGLEREILVGPADNYDIVVSGLEGVPLRNRLDNDYLSMIVQNIFNEVRCGVALAMATHC